MQDSPLRRWAITETVVFAVFAAVMVAVHVSLTTFYLAVLGFALAAAPISSHFIQKDRRRSGDD